MSDVKKKDGSTKSFVEYKTELTRSDTRVAQIASAGASAVGGTLLELSENQKRWMVTGICLNKVVTPQLRKYTEPHLMATYNNFKKTANIHSQTPVKHLKTDGTNKLKYEAINNNQIHYQKKWHLYDYNVASHVDMAKLYLQTHMAKFSAFDESCDPSAVLGILCVASCFPSTVQTNAKDVRANVRNEWAHCNFADWNEAKFVGAFQKIEGLMRYLGLPKTDTDDIVDQMNDWKNKGVLLCMGSDLDKDLLQLLYQEVSVLARYSMDIKEDTKNRLQEICNKINAALQDFERRLAASEKEQKIMGGLIRCVDDKVEKNSDHLLNLENENDALQEEQTKTKRRLGNLEEEHGCTLEDVKRLTLDQNSAEDKIQRLETKQTEISTEMPKIKSQQTVLEMKQSGLEAKVEFVQKDLTGLEEKVQSLADDKLKDTNSSVASELYCQAPNRNEYFSGREKELLVLEEAFDISESATARNKVVGISGLGGCGKTTLAAEYSWRCRSFYKGGVFWISAESENTFRKTIRDLAYYTFNISDSDFDQCLRATLTSLSRVPLPFLLVVDNADELELSSNALKLLDGYWMQKSKGHILVTTRRKAGELREVANIKQDDCITLGCYTREEAITFIQKRTKMTRAASDEEFSLGTDELTAVTDLVNELGGLPLAVEQAGAHIRAQKCTYSEYLREFRKLKMKLIQRQRKVKSSSEETSNERLAVHTTWLMNFEYASQLAKESGLEELTSVVIDVSAYLSPDDIPCDLINQAYSPVKQEEVGIEVSPLVVGDILEILTKFSLFQSKSRNSFSVHRLVQQVIQSRCSEERRADVLLRGMRMLDFAFRSTKSPTDALAEASGQTNPDDASIQGTHSLSTWGMLASNAVTLKSHLMDYLSSHLQAGLKLLYAEETAKVLGETAIYLSMCNQQPQAFESQNIMLQILADINNVGLLTNQVSIPLTDNERRVLRLCTRPRHIEKPETIPDEPVEERKQSDMDHLRLKGNEAFGLKDYENAVSIYTEAIKIGEVHACRPEDLSKLYSNRSMCYLKMDRPTDALHDTEECIKRDPHSFKGFFRRAMAMKMLLDQGKEEYKLAHLASAAMAIKLNPDTMKEAKDNFGPAFGNTRVVSTHDQWMEIMKEIMYPRTSHSQRETGWIVIFTSGKYEYSSCELANYYVFNTFWTHAIFIGDGDVEMNNVHFSIGRGSNYHFENIVFGNPLFITKRSFVSCMGCTFQNGPVRTFSRCFTEPCPGCRICHADKIGREDTIESGHPNLHAKKGSPKLFVIRCILRNSAGGILATNVGTSVIVRYCKIHNNLQHSVEARQGASVIVEENELFHSKDGDGVCLGPDAGSSRVVNNKIYGNEGWGIALCTGSKDITIEGNEIYENQRGGIGTMDSTSMVVRKNKIFENSGWGITFEQGSSDEVSDNVIHNNKCGGIRVATSHKVVLVRNKVTDHDGPGILSSPVRMRGILDGHVPTQSRYTPPVMIQNIEMRNEEGNQYPKEKPICIGMRCACCHKMQSDKVKLRNCTSCQRASYCDKNCQRQHWKSHKPLCKALKAKFSQTIDIPPTGQVFSIRKFHPSLKGIKQGPKPDRCSKKRFIVKILTLEDNPLHQFSALRLYDQSTDVDFKTFDKEIIHNIVVQCGVLGCSKAYGKKIFCYASFEENGKKLRIHLDGLAPFQEW